MPSWRHEHSRTLRCACMKGRMVHKTHAAKKPCVCKGRTAERHVRCTHTQAAAIHRHMSCGLMASACLAVPLPSSFLTLLGTVPARACSVFKARSNSLSASLEAAAALLPGLVAPRALLQVNVALRQTLQSHAPARHATLHYYLPGVLDTDHTWSAVPSSSALDRAGMRLTMQA